MLKIYLTFILLLTLFINVAYGALIDGPANIRSKPHGKLILSLDDGVLVNVISYENDWYLIALEVIFDKASLLGTSKIKKNSIIYDIKKNKLGKTLDTIEVGTIIEEGGKYLALIHAYTYKSNLKRFSDPIAILKDLTRGAWLNKDYLESLIHTKSPQKAKSSSEVTSFWFVDPSEDNCCGVIFNYGFHETSGAEFSITGINASSTKNTYELIDHEGKSRMTLILEGIHDEIHYRKNAYVRVEPSEIRFINRNVLAGEYIDNNNKVFIFTESGIAKWPERAFKYELLLDFVMGSPPCDIILATEKNHKRYPSRYGFTWKDDVLVIYDVSRDPEIQCNKNPLHVLRIKNEEKK